MRRWIIFIVFFITSYVQAQVLKSSLPFSTATPYLEPDGRKPTLKLSEQEFVMLSKTKGNFQGESSYQLEKYDRELSQKFKTPLVCPDEEDYKELFYNGTDIILFSVVHEENKKTSKLVATIFDAQSGSLKERKTVFERTVGEWQDAMGKGVVKSTFENEIASSLSKNSVTNLAYQYQIRYSPDNSKILVYAYDYSQKNLLAEVKILNSADLSEKHSGVVPVDAGFINYGIYPNNRGEIFILNSDRAGRIVMIYYNLADKTNKLLDIQNANTNRTSLTMQVLSDQEVYIACINISMGKLAGVMYAKFDFNQHTIEKINFHDLSVGIQQTAQMMRGSNKNLSGQENWQNYEIANFHVNEYEKIILVLEKREIFGNTYTYNNMNVNNPKNWSERLLKVNTEGMLLFSFNKDDELLWENFYQKAQSNDITLGTVGSSFSFNITDGGNIRMFYPSYENSTGTYNIVNYVEWDELSGNKTKDMKAPNDGGISMLTDYTVWMEDRVAVVGRKGILGKKSFINLYKLE
jgi:hypothetical protein